MIPIETLGIDHIDLTVKDLRRSIAFYEKVFPALGFRRVPSEGYVAWGNGLMNIGLRPCLESETHTVFNRYRPGLHHLALKARSREDVDRLHQFLVAECVHVLDAPAEYPQYGPGYYAVFFSDPDGMKLEVVHFPWGYWRQVQSKGRDERPRYLPPA